MTPFPWFVWITETQAINLAHVTTVKVHEGTVQVWDATPHVETPLATLRGEAATQFLSWFNKRVASSLHG
jgi:hypothetical protein